jgi:ParB family chromosome partitioning protein
MAKRKINAAMMLAAGEDAHLQTKKQEVSHAKSIDGEMFLELRIETIKNNPMQPRLHIDEEELEDLARSIKLHGLIQPIAVIKVGEDDYLLKAGHRRWLAHQRLGLKTIKAIVQEEAILTQHEGDKALFEIAVMENTQRDNLNPLELALSLRHAMDKGLYTNMEELALALGKSKSYISKVLKVLSLQEAIIHDLSKNKSTNDIESLYEIQKIKDPQEQVDVYFDFVAKKLDRMALRERNKVTPSKPKAPFSFSRKAHATRLELDLRSLDTEARQKLHDELEAVIQKYYKNSSI